MDPERALTIGLVAFVAGSTAAMLTLTVIGALTDGQDLLRFGAAAVVGIAATAGVGYVVNERADPEQLTGR